MQPYGLVIVPGYVRREYEPHRRLDFWCHGRGETLSELNFINDRQKSPGEFTPPDAFVLHPYGRYCNANKFAGEIDLFEALDARAKALPDRREPHRRCAASRWAAPPAGSSPSTIPSLWAAAAPGAGFSETPDFLKVFQNETAPADLVRAEALAPVRLHRLRAQPLQLSRPSPTAARSTGRSRPPT